VRAHNIVSKLGATTFDVTVRGRGGVQDKTIQSVKLPMPGNHNVQNALAAIAVGLQMNITTDVLANAFDNFGGVKRRFTITGDAGGVTVVDDYGHHPVEIAAVLKAARDSFDQKVVAVVQPHRYSRLKSLFEDFCTCFNDADVVIVTPIYEAGEQPIEGASQDSLVEGLLARGHRQVDTISGPEELAATVAKYATAGDVVVCLGAGSISAWANALPEELKQQQGLV